MSGTAFESRSTNIAALLGEDQRARVVVPEFQRGYSWNKKHVQVFWDDLLRFLDKFRDKDGPDKYFLGPIVVRYEGNEFIHLLDGQQRIATATILFSVIRDRARAIGTQDGNDFAAQIQAKFVSKLDDDGEDTGLFSLQMGEMDKEYFTATIQCDPPTAANPSTKSERTIRDVWNEMLEKMGRRDINRFFRHMWVSKYGDLKNVDLFTALRNLIEASTLGSLEFVRICNDECGRYVELLAADPEALGADAAPHIRVLVQEIDVQAALPILLASNKVLDRPGMAKVARWLLVYVTRYSIIGQLDPSGLENVLFKLARDIRAKAEQGADSKECLRHIKNILVKGSPTDEDTKRAAKKAVLAPEEAGYVLNRLANYIQSKTKEVKMSETNIEHVYPRNPNDNEWGGSKNHKVMDAYTWHLGNLTVFGKRLNRGAGNKEFEHKKKEYGTKTEVKMTKMIAEQYRDNEDWDGACIERRASELASIVPVVWSFNNPSRV